MTIKKKLMLSALFFIILMTVAIGVLISIRFPIKYLEIIEAHRGDFEPAFILAVIHAESSFRPHVVSHRGAMGLMQIMEDTGLEMSRRMNMPLYNVDELFIPAYNIAIGSFYLNWLKSYLGDDMTLILSGYNAGPGRVREWLLDERFSDDGYTLSFIPFPETRNYVQRVERNILIYEWLLRIYSLVR